MLNNHPRTQLCFIIQQYGQSIINEPKRCKGMLSDLAPQHRLENNLLITALEQKVAQDLVKPPSLIPLAMQLERLAQRLHDNHGTREDFAYWAVESWALALNVIQQPVLKQTVQSTSNTSTKPPSKVAVTQHSIPQSFHSDYSTTIANFIESYSPKEIITSSSTVQRRIGKFIVQDGIATDTETSLIWLRFAYGQTWQNGTVVPDKKLCGDWRNEKLVDWQAASNVAKQFNQQGGYAGYTDWRLPSIDELKSLIDKVRGKKGNYIDVDIFPLSYQWFWSSSFCGDTGISIVDFNCGKDYWGGKIYNYAVRLVRGKKL